jgi:hypothetical protein
MRSVQTTTSVPLAAVKPLARLSGYREFCLTQTRRALAAGAPRARERSPVDGSLLEPVGEVAGLPYARCPSSGSLFLARLPEAAAWAALLAEVSRYRHSPQAFHADLAQSRTDAVYAPKLQWVQDALGLQGLRRPRLLEVATPPSPFTTLLKDSATFSEVTRVDELRLASGAERLDGAAEAAVLLESFDRVDDPAALAAAVAQALTPDGLLFATALVASGFDMAVLGLRSAYLYPPDRANCFTLQGLLRMLERAGFAPLEVSTPGVLDVEIVAAHLAEDPSLPLSGFERQLLDAPAEAREAFQSFLQQWGYSSFARIVAKKRGPTA